MDLENELRRVLHTRPVPTSLTDPVGPIHAGMLRRRRTRRLHVASASLGVVVVALATSMLVSPTLRAQQTPAQQPTPDAVQPSPDVPVPPKFAARDLSFVSKDRGWAIGTSPCSTGRCSSLLTTEDGGGSWQVRTMPDATLPAENGFTIDCTVRTCISQIRFATAQVGYAFNPGLAVTRDGGRTWTNETVPGPVAALETASGNVVRLVEKVSCPGCLFDVQTADVGSTSWTTTFTTPQVNAAGASLQRQGNQVALLLRGHTAGGAGSATSSLALSDDGGATWTTRPEPCGGVVGSTEIDSTAVALAPGNVIVALCVDRSTAAASLRTSTDFGGTFGPPHALPPAFQSDLLTAARGVALVGGTSTDGPGFRVLRSTDDGRAWSEVVTSNAHGPVEEFLHFTTNAVATWIADDPTHFQRTLDAGKTWDAHTFR